MADHRRDERTIYEAYVGGLPLVTTKDDLAKFFQACDPKKIGPILKKEKSAYCFVQFHNKESQDNAFLLNKTVLNGRKIFVNQANSAAPRKFQAERVKRATSCTPHSKFSLTPQEGGLKPATSLTSLSKLSLTPRVGRVKPETSQPLIPRSPPFWCLINNLNPKMSATLLAQCLDARKVTKMYFDGPAKRALVEFLDLLSLKAVLKKNITMLWGNRIKMEYGPPSDLKIQATLKAPYICPATTPLSDKEVFDFPFLKDVKTIEYIKNHGKIFFLVRGPAKTRKFNLVTLLSGLYSAQSLSPSNYFDEPLLYNVNNLKGWVLNKQANHWCLYNVKTLMEANTPCIIVSTTSCDEEQVDSYMDQILKNGYTPIIAETTRKIEPPLESFNKKKGREETELEPYVPWYYGWFLNPKDSHLITKLGMEAAAELAPHVWQDLELPSADADIASIYIPEPYIFAMCRYCFGSKSQVGTRYYCSHEVTKHLGKVSRLKVQYFLIDKLHIWGMVELEQAQWEAMEHLQHLETDEADGVKELKHLDCVVKYPNVPTPSSSLTVKFISCKTTSQIKLTKMIIASTKKAKFPYKESIRSSDDVGMFPQGHSNELKFTGKRGKYYHLKSAKNDPCFLLEIQTKISMKALYTGLY